MRSLRSRTVENDSTEQEIENENTSKMATKRKNKLKKPKKSKKLSKKKNSESDSFAENDTTDYLYNSKNESNVKESNQREISKREENSQSGTSKIKKSERYVRKLQKSNSINSTLFADIKMKSNEHNSSQSSGETEPSFSKLVTSTNKKQIPNINYGIINDWTVNTQFSEDVKMSQKKARNHKTKSLTNVSLIHAEDSVQSKYIVNESTPKDKENKTYELVTLDGSFSTNKDKSPNGVSNWAGEREVELLCLDDVSEVSLNEIINISDEINNSKSDTYNISSETGGNTFFKEIDDKSDTVAKNHYSISGHSGEWVVQNLTEVTNISREETHVEQSINNNTNTIQNDSIKTPAKDKWKNIETNVLSPIDKSKRKKWIKFAVNSEEANSVLEEISTPKTRKTLPKTPIPKRSLNITKTPLKLLHSSESKSDINLTASKMIPPKNSTIKRTTLPNFARIHQRAYEKMESLKEYSERKKNRANMLLSSAHKTTSNKKIENQENINSENTKLKSSRELFTTDTTKDKYNRFGFKVKNISSVKANNNSEKKTVNKISKLPVRSHDVEKKIFASSHLPDKSSKTVFARNDVLAAANKIKLQDSTKIRDNKREILKGVRVNRRFELLMKMRNKNK